MFGCLVSGRIVLTNAQQVDANRFVFALDKANQVHHLAVFLLGTVALPEGFGASIFFGWPPYQDWKYLGFLTNAKPSAIFRLQNKAGSVHGGIDVDMGSDRSDDVVAQVGISIEPIAVLEKRHQELTSTASASSTNTVNPQEMQTYALKMCENLYNYLRSFASSTTADMIPTSSLNKWYENFQRKIKMDPYFWKTSNS